MRFKDVAIVTVRTNDYRIHFLGMTENEAGDVIKNANLTKEVDNYDNEKRYIYSSDFR